MFLLLAQLVAPPLQRGPVRLPSPRGVEERPAPGEGRPAPPVELPAESGEPAPSPAPPSGETAPAAPRSALPPVQGLTVYGPAELRRILAPCAAIPDPAERLGRCAEALTSRLVADGYISSRAYAKEETGSLEVVEGRIVELQVSGGTPWGERRVRRLLAPVQGTVLHLPTVQRDLQLLRGQTGLGEVRGRLARLGSDPAQASLTLTLPDGRPPWQGEVSLRNDGNDGSGEARAHTTLLKPSLAAGGDTLLLYGELNVSDEGRLGTGITSLSYTYPLSDSLFLTGAFGYSRRNLVELPDPLDDFSTSQYQALGQLEWVFRETLRNRWSVFAGYSNNRSNSYLDGDPLPDGFPESIREPASGYLRLGLNGSGVGDRTLWSGTAYLLQGIGGATPATQRQELASVGIEPGQASALGGVIGGGWAFAPGWQLNLRTGGQVAFQPLTTPMQFTIGSDVGLRGLPAQLISGDDGWLGTGEVVWTVWRSDRQALQLVPFIGAGWVRTELPDVTFSDTVGAGGILARWLQGDSWEVELGWVEQFSADDNLGEWTDWLLGQGLYARLQYRF
ncbi:MAG: ShlB/FhaC/HecB family hemolysin secretion/activation protein [Synechococcaceae cyanobacterium]|nr:ShlB/FhaC/HecB family hemolysin secretion/activation protein [Synechococcaceae cyanobacterium]